VTVWTVWLALAMVGVGLWLLHDGLVSPPGPRPQRPAARQRLTDWLVQAGLQGVTLTMLLGVCLVGVLAGGLVAFAVLSWPVADALGALAGGLAYPLWLRRRHERQRARIRQALVEAIERIRDAVGSGLDIGEAFRELADNGPDVLQPHMQQLCAELAVGVPFAEALQHLRDRLADPTFDLIARALALHDEVGGGAFGECLARVAHGVRSQISLRGRLAASRGRLYLSARILAALPLGLLAYVRWWSPTSARAYESPIGQIVLAVCTLVLVLAYALMLWLARLPDDERVLVRPL